MANGTLKVSNIQTSSGSGTITIGQSGETITIPSGCTITNSGTQTGFGGTNTPAFVAYKTSSTQAISNTTNTKVLFEGEQLDSGSVYDTSNSRFTPGVAGYYSIGAKWRYDTNTDFGDARFMLYINGSEKITIACTNDDSNGMTFSTVVYSDADDYFEMYARQNSGGSVDINGHSTYLGDSVQALFYGYKIIT